MIGRSIGAPHDGQNRKSELNGAWHLLHLLARIACLSFAMVAKVHAALLEFWYNMD